MTYEVVIKCPDMDDASYVLEKAIDVFDSHLVQMRSVGRGDDGIHNP